VAQTTPENCSRLGCRTCDATSAPVRHNNIVSRELYGTVAGANGAAGTIVTDDDQTRVLAFFRAYFRLTARLATSAADGTTVTVIYGDGIITVL